MYEGAAMKANSSVQFNIQIGDDLTWNVQPILHEARHALHRLLLEGETSIIDLRSIPLAPGEEEKLFEELGYGEVYVTLNALGVSEVYETQYNGVWIVTHFDTEHNVVGRFIEITFIPEILKSQREDMNLALKQLQHKLTMEQ